MFIFPILKKARERRNVAIRLYREIVAQSRKPIFYKDYGVQDTVEGRFDLIALHAGLVVCRLCRDKSCGEEGSLLAQALFDEMFLNMDWAMREMGIGDLGVPRRIKKMMSTFKGCSRAYDEAVRAGVEDVQDALIRNLYAGAMPDSPNIVRKMAEYVGAVYKNLESQDLPALMHGTVNFGVIENVEQQTSHSEAA